MLEALEIRSAKTDEAARCAPTLEPPLCYVQVCPNCCTMSEMS
jgi:hypothetical protein